MYIRPLATLLTALLAFCLDLEQTKEQHGRFPGGAETYMRLQTIYTKDIQAPNIHLVNLPPSVISKENSSLPASGIFTFILALCNMTFKHSLDTFVGALIGCRSEFPV